MNNPLITWSLNFEALPGRRIRRSAAGRLSAGPGKPLASPGRLARGQAVRWPWQAAGQPWQAGPRAGCPLALASRWPALAGWPEGRLSAGPGKPLASPGRLARGQAVRWPWQAAGQPWQAGPRAGCPLALASRWPALAGWPEGRLSAGLGKPLASPGRLARGQAVRWPWQAAGQP